MGILPFRFIMRRAPPPAPRPGQPPAPSRTTHTGAAVTPAGRRYGNSFLPAVRLIECGVRAGAGRLPSPSLEFSDPPCRHREKCLTQRKLRPQDVLANAVRQLLERGQKPGYLLYDEIYDTLPRSEEHTSELQSP